MGAFLLLVSFGAFTGAAQEPGIRVNIGIAAAKPGDSIDVPLTLSGGPDVHVGSISATIGIPKRILTYTGKELGLAVELAEGELEVTAAEDKVDSSQTVVVFSAKGKTCIRAGILGYLQFEISRDAQKGDIPLKLLDSEATTCEGAAVQLAKGDDGQLTLFALDEEIPVLGCFFFAH